MDDLKCINCGYQLDYEGQTCPKCNSKFIKISEDIMMSEEKTHIKKRNSTLYDGKKRYFEELIFKNEIFREDGNINYVYRKIDRLNNVYEEIIQNSDGSSKINNLEKITEHIGHGYDKEKKKNG